jgi:hypothetical protein
MAWTSLGFLWNAQGFYKMPIKYILNNNISIYFIFCLKGHSSYRMPGSHALHISPLLLL